MMKRIIISLLTACLLPVSGLWAQDFQYSQPTQFYLNPAFVGNSNLKCHKTDGYLTGSNFKFSNTTRSQWNNRFIGNLSSIELAGAKSEWSFGGFLQNDILKDVNFESQYLALATSYKVEIERKKFQLRFGYQIGFGRRNIRKSNFNFGDEFNGSGFNLSTTSENPSTGQAKGYIDYSSLGLLAVVGNYTIGVSGHHLTNPVISMWDGSDKLNRRFSIHLMKLMKFRNSRGARDLVYFTSEFKQLGTSQQLNLGLFYEMKRSAIDKTQSRFILGGTFRGVPMKIAPDGLTQSDAIIFHTAWQRGTVRLGYSFDAPVSKSRVFGNSHEISISYQWSKVECQTKEPPTDIGCPPALEMTDREIRRRTKNKSGRIKVWSVFDIIFN